MSTLSEVWALKRGEPPSCVGTEYRIESVITFCPWLGKEWSLPWSRLESLIFGNEDEAEKMELFFPRYHVVAIGQNLRGVQDDLRSFKVHRLRSFPLAHRVKYPPTAPFIWQLDVTLVP
ncbi:MAG TPA: hypothetical protein VHM90_21750 [Phycisphaerae bacterium]|nr:hypothetical protein [Phycisphaerae bacterium]